MNVTGNTLVDPWPGYEAALKATEQVIRQHSKTFYFATALLPREKQRAIRSLYAFCRTSDDLADQPPSSNSASTQTDLRLSVFADWQAEVARPASQQTNPVLIAWAHTREQYAIERRYERELLDGIRMDLEFHPYPTWEALKTYCYRVAATVGLLSMPVIGLAPGATFAQAAPPAITLGIALQLTNILRDVGEDQQRGRMYLPLEDLERFHLTARDIHNKVSDERFIALMQFEITRARALYQQALPGIAFLSEQTRPAVTAAALLYRRILNEIEAIHYQVHTRRAYTSPVRKVSMLPEILWTVLRNPPSRNV